ncbi:hypothetical protein L1987_76482 [Smallanthus sonchifolius]|uniref:Uncharacterized protein n=1 Tax=Smallanthus sonchifolius TaxID=185202 RepID=A0ACB8Z7F3_9ASTR|nr:hypothetical protein L1987_76482 [Smallanthus sonchifolius]
MRRSPKAPPHNANMVMLESCKTAPLAGVPSPVGGIVEGTGDPGGEAGIIMDGPGLMGMDIGGDAMDIGGDAMDIGGDAMDIGGGVIDIGGGVMDIGGGVIDIGGGVIGVVIGGGVMGG